MTDDSPTVRRCPLTTADGVEIEAECAVPAAPRAAIAMAHPHPQYGGDMHNNVVAAVWRAAAVAGAAVVRFNFRGVGRSGGDHGRGRAERADLLAALDCIAAQAPGVPLVIAGYSFGAEVALSVAHDAAAGWFCVAPVFRMFPPDEQLAGTDRRPKRLVIAEHDSFAPPPAAREATRGWPATTLEVAPGADHFFATGTKAVGDALTAFIDELTAAR